MEGQIISSFMNNRYPRSESNSSAARARFLLFTVFIYLSVPRLAFCAQSEINTPDRSPSASKSASDLPEVQANLASAPNVPPPITRKSPARVVVKLEVREVVKKLAGGVDYTFWTFGGS